MPVPLRIFVLADTHNHLPANIEALADGADEIWHLGDVCAPGILKTLEAIGPPARLLDARAPVRTFVARALGCRR